jgi:hypothetical protein
MGRQGEVNSARSVKRSPSSRLPNGLKMLCGIANLRYPDELVRGDDQFITQELQTEFTLRARNLTKNFWPELWEEDERALWVLREMRNLLRGFWEAKGNTEKEQEHARDWYIHRAREYYQRLMIQRQIRDQLDDAKSKPTKEEALNALSWLQIDIERRLNQPPAKNLFEDALFALQQRAYQRSLAPRCCAMKCGHPYFLKSKGPQKFCSPECFHESKKRSERKWWDENRAGKRRNQ